MLAVFLGSLAVTMLVAAMAGRDETTRSHSAVGYFAIAALAAALLALGPEIQALGRRVGAGPYLWLFEYVPGFDGLRVPARYLMLVALFLSVLAGIGAASLLTLRWPVGPGRRRRCRGWSDGGGLGRTHVDERGRPAARGADRAATARRWSIGSSDL